jgi:hypothetical protein
MLHAMRRGLETELRWLLHGHEGGKRRLQPRSCLRITAPVTDLPRSLSQRRCELQHPFGHGCIGRPNVISSPPPP